MTITLGTAPDSWGVWFPDDPKQTSWRRFLDEVAEVGYHWVELGPFGYLPRDAETLGAELARRSLNLAAGGVMLRLEDERALPRLRPELEQVCALLERFGASYLLVIDDVYTDLWSGAPLAPAELDGTSWSRLVRTTEEIAQVAEGYGLRTILHPHAQTHVETEQEIERFLADAPPEIGLCLDVGHHAYAGGDPIAFFRRHHTRIPFLHLKSVDPALQATAEQEGWPFARAVAEGVFVEPREGAVDFSALRAVLDEVGYDGFGIVEQDMYPAPADRPLPIALRTRAFLEEIGFGTIGSDRGSAVERSDII